MNALPPFVPFAPIAPFAARSALARRVAAVALTAVAGALLPGCAAPTPARMALPDALQSAPAVTLPAPGARSGGFALPAELGGGQVNFTRSADRLSVFGRANFDRSALRMQWQDGAAGIAPRALECRMSQSGVQLGGLAATVLPAQWQCEGSAARLSLQSRPAAWREGRSGQYSAGTDAPVLQIRSVHTLQGSPLPLDSPAGYLLLDGEQPVAALDLLGRQPQLRWVALPGPARAAVVEAALLLALAWGPVQD